MGVVLDYLPCRSYDEFVALDKKLDFTKKNLGDELNACASYAAARNAFGFHGHCSICRGEVTFVVQWDLAIEGGSAHPRLSAGSVIPCWKEMTHCPGCRNNSRQRAGVEIIEREVGKNAVIHIAEQGWLFRLLSNRYPLLIGSEYLSDGTAAGACNEKLVRCEDLMRLSFPDNVLDAALSFDVFEHISDYKAAIRELFRVLKPGGKVILTAPFLFDAAHTVVRASLDAAGNVTHFLPPEYHGSGTGPVLCYQDFGWDFIDAFRDAGFADACVYLNWNPQKGNLGDLDYGVGGVIVAVKAAA